MKLRFRGFALVPLLGVMFLFVISAVTSYVVINQGTGGYKARAAEVNCAGAPLKSLCNSSIMTKYCYWSVNKCVNRQSTTTSSTSTTSSADCLVDAGERCGMGLNNSCPDGGTVFCKNSRPCTNGRCGYGQGDGSCGRLAAGSTCKDTSSSCSGAFRSGYCPGPDTWKCCDLSTGGGAPESGGAPAAETPTDNPPTAETPTDETPTDETPTAETPTTTGNVTVALTLKLQGVTGNPKGTKTIPFKVKLKNETSTTDYATGTLTADSSGKWTGSVPFSSIALGADTGYSIYVKVGKHFQKRICVESPNESPVGTYSCSDNTIPLSAGQNNLDFTGILQLVGDLPVSGGQNGVVDSQDKGFLLNHQRSTSQADLLIGDLNFDGAIDTNDWSLILQSLNVKYDDE